MSLEPVDWDAELADAVADGDMERARAALSRGGDPNHRIPSPGSILEGATPLTDAALTEDMPMVALLVAHGAVVAAEAPELGSTSLHEAAESGNVELLELLLTTDLGPHLTTFDYIQRTPLHWAAARGHVEIARLLLDAGADVNARNEAGAEDSPLHVAVREVQEAMIAFLLSKRADPLARGWMGITPLGAAEGTRDPARVRIREMLQAAVCGSKAIRSRSGNRPHKR